MINSFLSIFKPNILNDSSRPSSPSRKGSSSPAPSADSSLRLVSELNRLILALFGEFLREDGHSVDYDALSKSDQFQIYKQRVCELQRIDLVAALATPQDKKVFFLNLYNMLLIHGFIQLGPPSSSAARGIFFSSTAYRIGLRGEVFSLNDIEHGVLRCNRRSPSSMSSSPQFSAKDDSRLQYVLPAQSFDPRVHFALVCGAKSCPPIRVYTLQNVENALNIAARSFCEQNLEITPHDIQLSSIFKWYATDFADTVDKQLEYVSQYLSDTKRSELQTARQRQLPVKYQEYDWSVNTTTGTHS